MLQISTSMFANFAQVQANMFNFNGATYIQDSVGDVIYMPTVAFGALTAASVSFF